MIQKKLRLFWTFLDPVWKNGCPNFQLPFSASNLARYQFQQLVVNIAMLQFRSGSCATPDVDCNKARIIPGPELKLKSRRSGYGMLQFRSGFSFRSFGS
jgi:hypothetical protein